MHYEVELGLIMGKTVRDLHPDDTKGAMDAIEGTILFTFTYPQHCPLSLVHENIPLTFMT